MSRPGSLPYRFPDIPSLGLGLGMDLHWSGSTGFRHHPTNGDFLRDKTRRFLDRHGRMFTHFFFAFQPRGRNVLDADEYFPAYDNLFSHLPGIRARAFHQTLLNMGAMEPYERTGILRFTNQLVRRYGLKWVVEDLGLWSIGGKTVPFPLPPFMTEAGLRACVENIRAICEGLEVPLSVEFPGFTEGTNFHIGGYDAFDFFRILAEETGVATTIDIGHILSYQWLQGRTGPRMFEDLERLPLESCFEFHLSGCQIANGKFRDLHHGILLDEQLDLLQHLLPLCRNLKAVTFEDPRYTADGALVEGSRRNFFRMKEMVDDWAQASR